MSEEKTKKQPKESVAKYTCSCGSVISNTNDAIARHEKTKKHINTDTPKESKAGSPISKKEKTVISEQLGARPAKLVPAPLEEGKETEDKVDNGPVECIITVVRTEDDGRRLLKFEAKDKNGIFGSFELYR